MKLAKTASIFIICYRGWYKSNDEYSHRVWPHEATLHEENIKILANRLYCLDTK